MKDFDLTNENGSLTIEAGAKGHIGIYYETEAPHKTLILNKEEFLKMAAWVVAYASTLRSD